MSIYLQVSGDLACFTRPEMKVERVSYDVITPSAARGVLEAIYWKPEIRWVIERIRVLKPIRWTTLRRNEVGAKASATNARSAMKAGRGTLGITVEDERQQRAATLLRDVAYVIQARFDILSGPRTPGKHLDQFNRRAKKGQCFQHPYLGCREFLADFEPADPAAPPACPEELQGEIDLGWTMLDFDYTRDRAARFFRAKMVDGVIDVPPMHPAAAVDTGGEGSLPEVVA
ncbi:type I-C CRISPR-associated protein Cas5c [Phycisphaera mikurensis]|uniref:pre-crRNA processing endonuclease n=1 Tax=Phycisphaera mikurensis (strain NBRC 102666 / KCTC 22515 / FYK2301M01) TaxID=1142394 RepID=I0IC64_PHYMF|nr:type I-C CRISPR-associated protein Cas5c [Phycisphaera mikurensis]MBB6441929.1 CRISPR-associated protein Cas5d [Phycisphaera mikurensis]BAM02852.1 CRISPR-associated protein [Phycisphaera mikurensis NBRC 102666]